MENASRRMGTGMNIKRGHADWRDSDAALDVQFTLKMEDLLLLCIIV